MLDGYYVFDGIVLVWYWDIDSWFLWCVWVCVADCEIAS